MTWVRQEWRGGSNGEYVSDGRKMFVNSSSSEKEESVKAVIGVHTIRDMVGVRKVPAARPEDDRDIFRQPGAMAVAAAVALGLRKKGAGVRTWLVVDATGESQPLEAGKHAIMRRTGLPARDLRILDPLLSYPSTVLGRERAIVINLEHIKAIITASEVLILNSRDPSVTPFVDELQKRALRHHHDSSIQNGRVSVDNVEWADMEDRQSGQSPKLNDYFNQYPNQHGEEHAVDMRGTFENQDALKALPFEFVALEACLEAACRCLENEAKTLEQEAHPALDKLTSKISTLNLERVRQIKSRLVAMTGRVQKVRDELEHLLDDDEDMAEMYLTDKVKLQHQLETSSVSSPSNNRDVAEDGDEEEVVEEDDGGADQSDAGHSHDHFYTTPTAAISRGCNHGTHTSTSRSAVSKHLEVEELEMLLEAYFVQIDGTLNNLSTLREYVDDTEDYINIMLDDKQNHLLQMGVMLTTATLVISGFVVVAGVFGMNIKIDMFDEETSTGMKKFLWTVGGGTTGSIFLYVAAIAWCKHKHLLE